MNGKNPAFPNGITDFDLDDTGLTKREYFAAMAMQGYIASSQHTTPENSAVFAVKCADELLKALEQ